MNCWNTLLQMKSMPLRNITQEQCRIWMLLDGKISKQIYHPSAIAIDSANRQQEWSTKNPVVATQDHYGRCTK